LPSICDHDLIGCCSQSVKENIWGLQYINLALLLHQNFDVPSEPKMNSLTLLNDNVVVNTENKINKSVSLHTGTTNGSLLIVNGVFSEIKSSPFMTLLSACTPIVLVCTGALGGKLISDSGSFVLSYSD
jgi:hypothetical protein